MQSTQRSASLPRWKAIVRELSCLTSDFPTKRRWLEMVFRRELRQTESMNLTLSGGAGATVSVVPSSVIGHEILLYGVYEKYVARRLLSTLKPGDLCIDIGANFGQYSLLASRRVGPTGRVISVEPVPHVFERLKDHLKRNRCDNVIPVNMALGDKLGAIGMKVIQDENDGMHHVTAQIDRDTIEVPVNTLDSLLSELKLNREVSVIKIDVEGWEQSVFTGAKGVLSQRNKPTIFFESIEEHAARFGFSAETVRQLLTEAGYSLETLLEPCGKTPRWVSVAPGAPSSPNMIATPKIPNPDTSPTT